MEEKPAKECDWEATSQKLKKLLDRAHLPIPQRIFFLLHEAAEAVLDNYEVSSRSTHEAFEWWEKFVWVETEYLREEFVRIREDKKYPN